MSGAAGVQKPQTLDELMMAMDVVDTIRHSELVVERELAQGDRDAALRARLREIYRGQGLEVSDAAIDQGIKALRESRFAYTPPAPGFGRSLALFWIRRGVYGRWVGSALVVATALWGINYFGFELPRQRAVEQARIELSEELPRALQAAAGAARVETRDPAVMSQIDGLERDGSGQIGPLAHLKNCMPGPDIPVLLHITTSLPHEPHRTDVRGPAAACIEETAAHWSHAHLASPGDSERPSQR
jgi:hypothetical protein